VQKSKRKRSLIRFSVWRYKQKIGSRKKKESVSGKFIIYVDWDSIDDHERIRDKIRKIYPGWVITGYGLDIKEKRLQL